MRDNDIKKIHSPWRSVMRVWDYPYDVVVVKCDPCEREGRYTKARFIEIVGADT